MVVFNVSRFKPRGAQLKPGSGGFKTRLKFIKFGHCHILNYRFRSNQPLLKRFTKIAIKKFRV